MAEVIFVTIIIDKCITYFNHVIYNIFIIGAKAPFGKGREGLVMFRYMQLSIPN